MYCSRAEVKRSMKWIATETEHDVFIDELLADVASAIDQRVGRGLAEDTYTEYLSGGRDVIPVTFWPIISVTSIHGDESHEFGSDTLIAAADYFVSDADAGLIRHKSGPFTEGSQNLKVVYQGGFEATPPIIRRLAVEKAVRHIKTRSNVDEVTLSHGDGSVTRRNLSEWDEHEDHILRPFMLV